MKFKIYQDFSPSSSTLQIWRILKCRDLFDFCTKENDEFYIYPLKLIIASQNTAR